MSLSRRIQQRRNICLGTMNFGWHTSQEESFKIMDRALELGINVFDTADVYGWGGEQGDTEEILGRDLASLRTTGASGQGGLCGVQQLPGMGHCHCLPEGFPPRFTGISEKTTYTPNTPALTST